MRRLSTLLPLFFALGCEGRAHPMIAPFDPGAPDAGAVDASADAADFGLVDGATSDAHADGNATDAASDGGQGGDAATLGRACSPAWYPSSFALVTSAATGPSDLFGAISWDERTIAWLTTEQGIVRIRVADRASPGVPFGAPQIVPDAIGPFALEKVALSADGLRLLFTTADHTKIGELQRQDRALPFAGPASFDPYVRLTPAGDGTTKGKIGDVVLSADGTTLFFTNLGVLDGVSMRASRRLADGSWDDPTTVQAPASALSASAGKRRRPTGVSADGLTLFYDDEQAGVAQMLFRPSPSAPFDRAVSLGADLRGVSPNAACDAVYLTAPTGPGADAPLAVAIAR
jgi:hypothetical protein